jgi:hypothetical protein
VRQSVIDAVHLHVVHPYFITNFMQSMSVQSDAPITPPPQTRVDEFHAEVMKSALHTPWNDDLAKKHTPVCVPSVLTLHTPEPLTARQLPVSTCTQFDGTIDPAMFSSPFLASLDHAAFGINQRSVSGTSTLLGCQDIAETPCTPPLYTSPLAMTPKSPFMSPEHFVNRAYSVSPSSSMSTPCKPMRTTSGEMSMCDTREEARRAKNRIASRRNRERKKQQDQELLAEYQELVEANRLLLAETQRLRGLLEGYRSNCRGGGDFE